MQQPLDLKYDDEQDIDLNEMLVEHPSHTQFIRVQNKNLVGLGIGEGDLIIVDRFIKPKNNSIAVVIFEGNYMVKRITKNPKGLVMLMSDLDTISPITVLNRANLEILGVVTHSIRILHKPKDK